MFERLLVPIDGGALDEHAFEVSVDLARQLGATITGFIVEPFATAPPPAGFPSVTSVRTDTTLQAHAQQVLARFHRLAREAGVPFRGVVTQAADVGAAIVAAAQEHRCDMIVMTTRGGGWVSELLRGSNTRQVISRVHLPVLVLH